MASLSSPTAQDLITNIRLMLNQPVEANSTWTNDEILIYVNEGIRRYYTEVVQNGNGEFNTSTTLNLVANTETVPLPSDFFQVRALYRNLSNGMQILPYRNNLTEGYSTNDGGGSMYTPYYYLRGNSLVLRPVANFAETSAFTLEYVQFPETMITGGDSLTTQVSPVFRDLIETYAVYKAKVKESAVSGTNTTSLIKQNLDDLYIAFKDVMSKRTKQPTYVQMFNPEDI